MINGRGVPPVPAETVAEHTQNALSDRLDVIESRLEQYVELQIAVLKGRPLTAALELVQRLGVERETVALWLESAAAELRRGGM